MEEYFEILDEKGNLTGRKEERHKCHEEGLWHKAVFVFILNSKSQVLLQKRSSTKKMWPNKWDVSAGGHVLAGEFGFQAIIREVKEELGISLEKEDITFIGTTISTNKNGERIDNHFNEAYIVHKEIDETKLQLQSDEVAQVKWMEQEEIIQKVKNKSEELTEKQGCWEVLLNYYEWENNLKR